MKKEKPLSSSFKEFKNNKGEGFTNLKIESSGVD